MEISQLINIFKRHIILLILVPVILATTVYFLTRGRRSVFSSQTIVYTGIGSGYDIETTALAHVDYFGTSMQFDNLINLIFSRQTIEKTAIKLLALHLSLDNYDPRIISQKNFNELMEITPKEVKDLVVIGGRSGVDREKTEQLRRLEEQIRTLEGELENKRNTALHVESGQASPTTQQPVTGITASPVIVTTNIYHSVRRNESLNQIAQRYNLTVSELMSLNNLKIPIVEPGIQLIVGKETLEQPVVAATEPSMPDHRVEGIHGTLIPTIINQADFEATVANLTAYYEQDTRNFVYELLNYEHPNYSIRRITAKTTVYRIQNSDLLRVTYNSDDPAIAFHTLRIMTDVFIENFRMLKVLQTDAVVEYFQNQVHLANDKLRNAEDRLLKFNQENNIINFPEQTKYIAEQKEELDRYYQNEQIRMSGASASLNELETKLVRKDSVYLKSDIISKKREQLSLINERIVINRLAEDYDPYLSQQLVSLENEAERLKDEITFNVNQLYLYSHSIEGIPIQNLLTEWLRNVIVFEESKAALNVLDRRREDFRQVFQIFAPLGATLNRLEREINVAEQSYLELLRSLNLAKMRQQNLEMSLNIKVVDEPFFPITPNPARRFKLLIVLAAVAGFMMVAFVLLMLEYFDSSFKSLERVEKFIGLRLAGAYPKLPPYEPNENVQKVANRLIDFLAQNIRLKLSHVKADGTIPLKPYFVLFFSTRHEAGKTLIINHLISRLRSLDLRVLFLNHSVTSSAPVDMNAMYSYNPENKFPEISDLTSLLDNRSLRAENYSYDYIFLELPAIILSSYPQQLIKKADMSLLVVRSEDRWEKSDIVSLNLIMESLSSEPMVVLNNAELIALEDLISGIGRTQKTDWGKRVKRIITFPFRLRVNFKQA